MIWLKDNWKRVLWGALLVATLWFIYGHSMEVADDSTEKTVVLISALQSGGDSLDDENMVLSNGKINLVALLLKPIKALIPMIKYVNFDVLRKIIHVLEFAWLGFVVYHCFRVNDDIVSVFGLTPKIRGVKTTFTLLSGFFMAFIDETIQFFVPGRSSEVTDVWIDFSGILIGAICGVIFSILLVKVKKLYEKNKIAA